MTKIIQPLSDPDEIREEAAEATKEQYADYYVNQTMPDPLTWQSRTQRAAQKLADDPQAAATELSQQNDPLKDVE